jgi:hypothetical protein
MKNMKKPILVFPFHCLLIFVWLSFGFMDRSKEKKMLANRATGFAVVELFTSEGCSSCPPADEAVSLIMKEYPDNVYILGFHVDYWNYLGWKDQFSMAAFSKRQSRYAESFGLNSIYTPQIVVNGTTQFTGSDKNKLHQTVEADLVGSRGIDIELSAQCEDQKNVVVNYRINAVEMGIVNIALVQLHASSAIQRGENKGKILEQVNIVRAFRSFGENAGRASFVIPNGLSAVDCRVIAFVQDKNNLYIAGAEQAAIN